MNEWEGAVCRETAPDAWFPKTYAKSAELDKVVAACHTCPLIGKCREVGMSEEHGVWGGLVPLERARLGMKVTA